MQKDKVLPGPSISQQDPAEGSRDVVARELRRQKDERKDKEDTDAAKAETPPAQTDVIQRAELALDVKGKAE